MKFTALAAGLAPAALVYMHALGGIPGICFLPAPGRSALVIGFAAGSMAPLLRRAVFQITFQLVSQLPGVPFVKPHVGHE